MALVAGAAISRNVPVDAQSTPDPVAIIQTYAATGRVDVWFNTWQQAASFAKGWSAGTDRWIDAGTGESAMRRAQLAALTALELGRSSLTAVEEWRQTGIRDQLFDAAHARLRRVPPNEFEHQWLVATTGLVVSSTTTSQLPLRLITAAMERFPKDGRFRLNRALMERDAITLIREPGTKPSDLELSVGHGDKSSQPRRLGLAEKLFRELLDDPDVGLEARARLGWLRFHRNALQESLTLLTRAADDARDPYVKNLAALGAGLIHEIQGRPDAAVSSLRLAVVALPRARTSTTALAAQLFLLGHRQEAEALLDGLTGVPNVLDPWRDVAGADRFSAELTVGLRSNLGIPSVVRTPASPPAPVPRAGTAPVEAGTADQAATPSRRADFSARTSMVAVDVSVTAGRRPVAGLSAADFELRDNGVLQSVESVSIEAMPLDVSVVLDLREPFYAMWNFDSATRQREVVSVVDDATRQGVIDTTALARLLGSDDRLRIVTATRDVAEPRALQGRDGSASHVVPREQGYASALHDAIFTALARATPADRRHLVLVFTDGIDGASIVSPAQLVHAASVADALVMVIRRNTFAEWANPPEDPQKFSAVTTDRGLLWPHDQRHLIAVAEATGGSVERINSTGESVVADVKRTLDSFRQRYILRYKPTGVEPGGWHNLTVRVTKPGRMDVQARRGYFGG
jgi:VWFA-related protein